jgi:uncharacterized protein (TIGR02678 family)
MSLAPTTLELQAAEERQAALRALLVEAFVGAERQVFALVHQHEAELASRCSELLGYRLEVTASFARLVKVPTDRALKRPLRVPPAGGAGRERPRDEWPALSDRGAVLLLLTLAGLERAGAQTVIGELADAVRDVAARCEPPFEVDFDRRPDRVAFADGLLLLCHWGVLNLVHGAREGFVRLAVGGEEEALFTIDRKRLAFVLRDPFTAVKATSVDDLREQPDKYAPTPEGQARRLRHRVARRLVDDPVLYLDELDDDERAYFLGQRALLERRVAEWVGLQVERRIEGSAAIETGRALTDLPYPAQSTIKQLALLLCDALSHAHAEGLELVGDDRLRAEVRALLQRHGASWNRDPNDPAVLDGAVEQARRLLIELDLAGGAPGGLRLRPLLARFRTPQLRHPGATDGDSGVRKEGL